MTTDPEIAAVVIDALEEFQRLTIETVEAHSGNPEAAVKALVRLHLEWTGENPERAVMVARHRNAVADGPDGKRLAAGNRVMFTAMKSWIDREAKAGRVPRVSFNLMHAVIFAPAQEIAKLATSGRLKKPLPEFIEPLGRAAWSGLRALDHSDGVDRQQHRSAGHPSVSG